MITAEFCQTMARYNAWQHEGYCEILKGMKPAALKKDRKAFFGSIIGTYSHLLWGDQLWMSRFDGGFAPKADLTESSALHDDLQLMLDDRLRTDQRIIRWADKVRAMDLTGNLTWFSGSINAELTQPKARCVVHFFNHQTHHRGQLHAMLTAAGHTPQATDIPFMPEVD